MILTQKTTKILGIVASVLAFIIGVLLVIVPAVEHFNEKVEEIVTAESEVGVMQANRDGYMRSQTMYPEISKVHEDLNTRFPELSQHSELLNALSEAATSSGMPSSAITGLSFSAPAIYTPPVAPPAATPEGEEGEKEEEAPAEGEEAPVEEAPIETQSAGGEYATMEVSFQVEGQPRQVQAFLDSINKLDRSVMSKGFSSDISRTGDGGGISAKASFVGQVFVFKKIASPETIQEQPAEEQPGEEG